MLKDGYTYKATLRTRSDSSRSPSALSGFFRNRDYGSNNCDDFYGFDCRDPEAPTDCASDSPTPSPVPDSGDPECEELWIGEGICHDVNNNEECGWDGGKIEVAATLDRLVHW